MPTSRQTKQRTLIMQALQGRLDHPTAEQLHRELSADYPHLGLSTVYRNLELLVQRGELATAPSPDGVVHFDPNLTEHAHFYCTRCKRLLDLPLPEQLTEQITLRPGQHVEAVQLLLSGQCEECGSKTDPQAESQS